MTLRPLPMTVAALIVLDGVALALAARTGSFGSVSDIVWLSGFSVFAVVGALILQHRPRHVVGVVFVVAGVGPALADVLDTLGILAGGTVGGGLGMLAQMVFGITWIVATTYALLFFPDGRLPSRRWRPVAWSVAALCVVVCVAVAVSPTPYDDPGDTQAGARRSPFAVQAWGTAPDTVIMGCLAASAIVSVIACSSLVVRWRRADGATREQLSWLGLGALFLVALTLAGWLVGPTPVLGPALETVQIVTLPLVTLAAMGHRRLFDVELVLRRSLVYAALTVGVVATYAATLALSSHVVGAEAGTGAAIVASAVVAVALAPVRDVLDRLVGRWLFGDRRSPAAALALIGAGLTQAAPQDDVLAVAAEAIRTTLALGYVALHADGRDPVVAGPEEPTSAVVEVEMTALGRREGVLAVAPRDRGDRLTARDLRLVEGLARQVALTARSVRLGRDLQLSRERIVAAREHERLRLRRDLHDGLGPLLAGVTLQMDALAAGLPASSAAAGLADRIRDELGHAVAVVRQAVDGLRPADLDQLGLAGVLGQRARSLSSGDVAVEIACPDVLTVSPAAEVAAYRIVSEALTNAVRHGRASRCSASLRLDGAVLVVRVEDDGIGMEGVTGTGVGMTSMRERSEEIGGSFAVRRSETGGTVVEARLPSEVTP